METYTLQLLDLLKEYNDVDLYYIDMIAVKGKSAIENHYSPIKWLQEMLKILRVSKT